MTKQVFSWFYDLVISEGTRLLKLYKTFRITEGSLFEKHLEVDTRGLTMDDVGVATIVADMSVAAVVVGVGSLL